MFIFLLENNEEEKGGDRDLPLYGYLFTIRMVTIRP